MVCLLGGEKKEFCFRTGVKVTFSLTGKHGTLHFSQTRTQCGWKTWKNANVWPRPLFSCWKITGVARSYPTDMTDSRSSP